MPPTLENHLNCILGYFASNNLERIGVSLPADGVVAFGFEYQRAGRICPATPDATACTGWPG